MYLRNNNKLLSIHYNIFKSLCLQKNKKPSIFSEKSDIVFTFLQNFLMLGLKEVTWIVICASTIRLLSCG